MSEQSHSGVRGPGGAAAVHTDGDPAAAVTARPPSPIGTVCTAAAAATVCLGLPRRGFLLRAASTLPRRMLCDQVSKTSPKSVQGSATRGSWAAGRGGRRGAAGGWAGRSGDLRAAPMAARSLIL